MKTATVAELRNEFRRVSNWLEDGETIEIRKWGKVVAHLVPASDKASSGVKKPDIMRRLREMWGKRVFSKAEVEAMRAAELEREDA